MDIGRFTMAEVLAQYSDKMLRKGAMRDSLFTPEEMIEHQVALFSHIIDKDLYFEVYRNHFARRLLQEKTEDMEMEKQMLTNLKINCGLKMISRLEGMITDINQAKNDVKHFKEEHPSESGQFEYVV
jgi:cullin 3